MFGRQLTWLTIARVRTDGSVLGGNLPGGNYAPVASYHGLRYFDFDYDVGVVSNISCSTRPWLGMGPSSPSPFGQNIWYFRAKHMLFGQSAQADKC